MVNLHLENIDIDYPLDHFQKDLYYTLGGYYKYCDLVSRWMWNPERLEKVTWKTSATQKSGDEKGVWIDIEAVEENEYIDIIESFCDSDFVLEQPDKRSPRIKTLKANSNKGTLLLSRTPKEDTEFLYLPPNDYVINQQKRAIQKLQDKPEQENRGLIRLFENREKVEWGKPRSEKCSQWDFLTNENIEGTSEQRKFVEIALGTPDFAILEGPPGSGKTTTICELILQEIQRGKRILLCASTHVAVDNVLEALQEHGSTEDKVLAVRIGNERRISESVQDFQLQKRESKERKDLIKRLSKIKKKTKPQQYLLDALQSPEGDHSIITRLILESANLVCGTTIGILQHPDIKAVNYNRRNNGHQGDPVLTPFDCLILDEASKTTFQEFLVPALYCRKWILVGDIQQLSPYVETTHIEDNIRSLIEDENDTKVCIDIFHSWNRPNKRTNGIIIIDPKDPEKYIIQAEKLGVTLLNLTERNSSYSPLDILSAQIILTPKSNLPQIENILPPDFIISPPEAISNQTKRRHSYWLHHHSSNLLDYTKERSTLWAQEIAWRLSRSFELRDTKKNKHYDSQISGLLPQWYNENESNKLGHNMETIKRIALPSVLELIQRGFGRRIHYLGSALTDGLEPDLLKQRHVKLSYQHRMHPEISTFPRESIYNSESLQDPVGILEKRKWNYTRYPNRAGWIQTIGSRKDTNLNEKEADIVIRELKAFIDWAKKNPKKGSKTQPWSIAILTFYRKQESHLRRRIRKLTGSNFRSRFTSKDGSTVITLCTVDRFQGHEADMVILSFVRNRSIGFLDSPNRLNVAITRARYQLVLVGNRMRFARQKRDNQLKKLAETVPIMASTWRGGKKQ